MQTIREVSDQPDWSILLAAVSQRCGEEVFLASCDISRSSRNGSAPSNTTGAANNAAPSNTAAVVNTAASKSPLVFHVFGVGQSPQAISTFVLRLQEIPIFQRVKLLQTMRQEVGGNEAFAFQLDCSIAADGEAP
jgi:hypothetical protein